MTNDAEKFGMPEAPAAPVLELPEAPDIDVPEAAEPVEAAPAAPEAPAPAPRKARKAPEPPRKVRRVGTSTMGVLLILVGITVCLALMRPGIDLTLFLRLSPLVLVALGVEVLIAARQKEVRLKYDFASMIICFLLVVMVLGASCVPILYATEGPPRTAAERVVEQSLSDATFAQLKSSKDVANVSYHISLNLSASRTADQIKTPDDLLPSDSVYVDVQLSGPYADEAAFAAACRPVIEAVLATGVHDPRMNIRTQELSSTTDPHYMLSLDGPYQLAMDAEGLVRQVEKSVYVPDARAYMTPEDQRAWEERESWDNHQQELDEMQRQAEEMEMRAAEAEERAAEAEARAAALEEQLNSVTAALDEAEQQLLSMQEP